MCCRVWRLQGSHEHLVEDDGDRDLEEKELPPTIRMDICW